MENMKIMVECSARHVHVTKSDLAKLFGEGYQLHNVRELSQPGQYLTEERVRIEGPKGAMDRVSILGPERPVTQLELSATDARKLGLSPPVRESGDVKGSAPVRIVGPAGSIDLPEGAIIAKRHLHITPEESAQFGLRDRENVMVKIPGERALLFDETVVRVSDKFQARMHIDVDEYNAAGITSQVMGEVLKK